MGRIDVVISDGTEKEVREHIRGKGDLSKIVEEALKLWLKNKQGSA